MAKRSAAADGASADPVKERLRALTAGLMLIPGLSGHEDRVRRRIAVGSGAISGNG